MLVVGGGIGGLTLAWWLDRGGHRVEVVERVAAYRPVGSMTTMYGEGQRVAAEMGLLDAFRDLAFRQERQVLRDRRGRTMRTFDLRRAHDLQRGSLTLRRADWQRLLFDAVDGSIPIRFGATVRGLEQAGDEVAVEFADGTAGRYDLVVGADGVWSSVRGLAFPGEHRRPLGLGLTTFVLDGVEPLRHDVGLAPYTVNEWFVPGRYIELTALSAGTLAGIFVYPSLPGGRVPPPAERPGALLERFADAPEAPRRVVAAIPDPSLVYCDDMAQVVMPRWSNGRVVLLGDAAWALSPMLGAGGGKAMRGAYALAGELAGGANPSAAFARYEEALRPAVDLLQRQTLRMARFALDGRPLAALLKQALFRLMPEKLVVRMRSAPPQGTAFADPPV